MQVERITTLDDFRALKAAWTGLHDQDPEAGYFLSWAWMEQVLTAYRDEWLILAAREGGADGPYVCFLPLKFRMRWSKSGQAFKTRLAAAGKLDRKSTRLNSSHR